MAGGGGSTGGIGAASPAVNPPTGLGQMGSAVGNAIGGAFNDTQPPGPNNLLGAPQPGSTPLGAGAGFGSQPNMGQLGRPGQIDPGFGYMPGVEQPTNPYLAGLFGGAQPSMGFGPEFSPPGLSQLPQLPPGMQPQPGLGQPGTPPQGSMQQMADLQKAQQMALQYQQTGQNPYQQQVNPQDYQYQAGAAQLPNYMPPQVPPQSLQSIPSGLGALLAGMPNKPTPTAQPGAPTKPAPVATKPTTAAPKPAPAGAKPSVVPPKTPPAVASAIQKLAAKQQARMR